MELKHVEFDGESFLITSGNMPQWSLPNGIYMGPSTLERRFSDVITQEIKDDDNFLDAGTNFGSYAFLASRRTKGRVVAIEPCFENFAIARLNLKKYTNTSVLLAALSDKIGLVDLHINKQNHGGHTLLNDKEYADVIGANDSTYNAQFSDIQSTIAITVDSLGIPFDIMKIDTEGYEMQVIEGASGALMHVRLMCIETHFQGKPTNLIERLYPVFELEIIKHGVIARRKHGY